MSNQDSTTLTAAPDQAAPRKRRRRSAESAAPSPLPWGAASADAQSDQEQPPRNAHWYWRQSVRWFHGAVAAGYGISLIAHAVVLLALSLIIYVDATREDPIQTTIGDVEEAQALEDITDVRIDMPVGDPTISESLQAAANMELSPQAENRVLTGVEDSLESLFDREGADGAGGAGFVAPANAKVFRKGNFSAWTVPDNPNPGQDYVIMIVVKLPERINKYQATDLKGIVVGTDGYQQQIPGPEYSRGRVYLPMKDHTAQLAITVPGAAARVKDRIEIRSTLLNEKQILEITF